MRLALSGTELNEGEDIAVLIDAAVVSGIDAVELWHPRNTAGAIAPAAARLADAGLSTVCLSAGIELYRDIGSEHEREKLLALIRLAADAGIPMVNTYFGFSSVCDDVRAIEGYLHWSKPCIALAERLGITIVIENEFNAFGWDPAASDVTRRPAALRRLLERAGSAHFRTTFDPANFACAGVEDLMDAYRTVAPFVAYVHVKDVMPISAADGEHFGYRRYSDFERSYRTCPLGEGLVPWPALLAALARAGYRGVLTLEPHSQVELRTPSWAAAAERLRELLDASAAVHAEEAR